MEKILLTVPEVAEILRCNQSRVHALRKAWLLEFLKLGQYKCRMATLEKFLEDYDGYDVSDPENVVKLEYTEEE